MASVIVLNDLSGPILALLLVVFGFGYITHEFMHLLVLRLAGVKYDITYAGDTLARSVLRFGQAIDIETEPIPPALAVAYALAPGVLMLPGWWVLLTVYQQPVWRLSWLLGAAVWIIVFMPSTVDWRDAWLSVLAWKRGLGAIQP